MFKRMGLATIAFSFASTAGIAAAEPNGRLSGEVDGNAFDVPVFCGTETPFFTARSHSSSILTPSKNDSGELAVLVSFFGKRLAFTGYFDGDKYQFGAKQKLKSFPHAYEGTIRSKDRGEYEAAFTLECPDS